MMVERFEVLGVPLEVRFSLATSMNPKEPTVTYCSIRRQDRVSPMFAGCAFLHPHEGIDFEMGDRWAFKRAIITAIHMTNWWGLKGRGYSHKFVERLITNSARKARWEYNKPPEEDKA